MGNILVSLNDREEAEVRRVVKANFGEGKGAIKAAVWAGIQTLDAQNERKRLIAQAMEHMTGHHSGLKPGERYYRERGELYD